MGIFITMEGTDGAGKTTQIELLYAYLIQNGFAVLKTREPGGTDISEKIRDIIIDTENIEMTDMTEALLYAAARAQLVEQVIRPALQKGTVVISDRFVDSSIVYQGMARGLGKTTIEEINRFSTGGLVPDVTFFLDLPVAMGIVRKSQFEKLDRIEKEKYAFHDKVYRGYVDIMNENQGRIKRIDANNTIELIHQQIVSYTKEVLYRG